MISSTTHTTILVLGLAALAVIAGALHLEHLSGVLAGAAAGVAAPSLATRPTAIAVAVAPVALALLGCAVASLIYGAP